MEPSATARSSYSKGASVVIKGLVAREDLNGQKAYVATGSLNPKTGRVVVVVGATSERVKIKPSNFDVRLPEAVAEVLLSSPHLLALAFTFLPRWERWSVLAAATKGWRDVIRGGTDADIFRHIVVVPAAEAMPTERDMRGRLQRLPGRAAYTVHRYMHQGALPLRARELALIPRKELVEVLIVPGTIGQYAQGDAFPDLVPKGTAGIPEGTVFHRTGSLDLDARYFHLAEMRVVCEHRFPALRSLRCNFRGLEFHYPGMAEGDLEVLRGWLQALPPTLEVLDFNDLSCHSIRSLYAAVPFARLPRLRACGELPLRICPEVELNGLHVEALARLEAAPWSMVTKDSEILHTGSAPEGTSKLDGVKACLKVLPSLRSFSWAGAAGDIGFWEDFVAAIVDDGPNVERVFLSLDSMDLFARAPESAEEGVSYWAGGEEENARYSSSLWELFAPLAPQLKEFFVDCDSCLVRGKSMLGCSGDDPLCREQNEILRRVLPNTQVLLCDVCDCTMSPNICASREMERYFLPDMLEDWQAHPLVFEQETFHSFGRSKLTMDELQTDQKVNMLMGSMARRMNT